VDFVSNRGTVLSRALTAHDWNIYVKARRAALGSKFYYTFGRAGF
jgi:hypothetical protein